MTHPLDGDDRSTAGAATSAAGPRAAFVTPKRIRRCAALLTAFWLAAAAAPVAAQALTPAFTYQGELRLGSGPANANFDMQFRLFSALSGGSQIGATVAANNVAVSGGLFAVPLDFGPAQFAGDRQWLQISIRPAGAGSYETLAPRTELTAAPYAWSAAVALANSVTGSSIVDGSVGTAEVNAAQVQRRVVGTCPAGQYLRIVNQDGSVTCGTDGNSGGTVTSIATGAGLTGGPITSSGLIAVAPGAIGTALIDPTQVQRRIGDSCAAGSYMRVVNENGTVTCATDTVGWGLSGNGNTDPASNFLGTTDNRAFVIRTRNTPSLRIQPSFETFGGLAITTNSIGGSHANAVTTSVRGATIAGGGVPAGDSDPQFSDEAPNRVSDHYGSVGGGYANLAGDDLGSIADRPYAVVGGGIGNTAGGNASTVAGGRVNLASGSGSSIGGGQNSIASGNLSVVGGGGFNTASAFQSTVSGGQNNTASGIASSVGGGTNNVAGGNNSSVGGGTNNVAVGNNSSVGGGTLNCAGGALAWVGGRRAKVRPGTDPGGSGACSGLTYPGGEGDSGSFVWADSQNANFVSTGSNQFLLRAGGGAAINSNDPAGNALRVAGTLRVDTLGTAAANTLCRNASNQIAACSSSLRYKQDIGDLELGLDTALRLHAVGYRWIDTGEADVGFVAEEIAAIDERLITRNAKGEVEGIKYERLTAVLANAVQELAVRERMGSDRLTTIEAENDALRSRLQALEARLGLADAAER